MIRCTQHAERGFLVWAALALPALAVEVAAEDRLDAERVRLVASLLPDAPAGIGQPISDRRYWDELAGLNGYRKILFEAQTILAHPLPDQPDDLFLEFSRTGNRTRWQSVAFRRRSMLTTLVLAECLEDRGRFLPRIGELVAALAAEPTWVMPAHDGGLANFRGKSVDIDLASSALAWNLATADWQLGERLPAPARQQIRTEIERRVLTPFRDAVAGKRPPLHWMLVTNNWNAVCLAGVVGAALEQIADRSERAEFVAAAEVYSRHFLAGFTSDGYCSEGLGYWNYGFGHYVLLSETVRQATGGRIDLMARPEARMPALFGFRIPIVGGIAPAFADCAASARPDPELTTYIARRFGLEPAATRPPAPRAPQGTLFETAIYDAALDAPGDLAAPTTETDGLRTWFEQAGILIGRPDPKSACRLGVALKGGHNAEHHNHNDIGSFVVVLGNRPVLLDPGAETYTARTFSSRRYESPLLNSFGHPVPRVAGQLQREGSKSRARVLETSFTDAADRLRLDLASAYAVPGLKRLEREFVYERDGAGRLTVTDTVELADAQAFGTALLTLGTWRRLDDGSLRVEDGKAALRVRIDAGSAEVEVTSETIREDAPVTPTRIGINLARPTAAAAIRLTITPE